MAIIAAIFKYVRNDIPFTPLNISEVKEGIRRDLLNRIYV
jgi:hypothetical protein